MVVFKKDKNMIIRGDFDRMIEWFEDFVIIFVDGMDKFSLYKKTVKQIKKIMKDYCKLACQERK